MRIIMATYLPKNGSHRLIGNLTSFRFHFSHIFHNTFEIFYKIYQTSHSLHNLFFKGKMQLITVTPEYIESCRFSLCFAYRLAQLYLKASLSSGGTQCRL